MITGDGNRQRGAVTEGESKVRTTVDSSGSAPSPRSPNYRR